MNVKDVMNSTVVLINPSTNLKEAAEKMAESGVGFLPVGEDDRLQGTVTDHDIVIRGLSSGKDANSTPIREILTGKLIYCSEDQDVEEAARLMGENQVRRLPVVNADKRLTGIISIGDMAQHLSHSAAGKLLSEVTAHG